MEDKILIAYQLQKLLSYTREYHDELIDLIYEKDGMEEFITAHSYADGMEMKINITGDSGIAVIKDVMKALEKGDWK